MLSNSIFSFILMWKHKRHKTYTSVTVNEELRNMRMKKTINILGLLIIMNSQPPQNCLKYPRAPHTTLWESQHHTPNSLDVKTEHFKFTLYRQRLLSLPYTLYIAIHLTVSEGRTNWSKWRGIQILAWILSLGFYVTLYKALWWNIHLVKSWGK